MVFLWVVVSDLWSILLFIPLGFIVLSVVARTVIFVIPPPLRVGPVVSGFTTFTALGLKTKSKDPPSH